MKHILLTAALAAPLAFSSARAEDGLGTDIEEHHASDIFSQCAIALSH
jgi:hypothetical protein